MFHSRPTIGYVAITSTHTCAVVDDFLAAPRELVAAAVARQGQFAMDPDNYYPGLELPLGTDVAHALEAFFNQHIRACLGARRTLHTSARLALATLPGNQLNALQRLCHRDALTLPAGEGVAASVAYLFDDPAMGGTSFYLPRQPDQDTAACLARAASGELPLAPGYMTASNDWFEQVATIPAKFNRAIFYDGTVFHAAQIARPDLLSPHAQSGRLTMNGFFRYRRTAA